MGSARQFRDTPATEPVPLRERPRLRHLAHEFNNLFTGATLYCDLLRDGLKDDPQLLHYAQELHLATEQGIVLAAELLALARGPSAGEDSLTGAPSSEGNGGPVTRDNLSLAQDCDATTISPTTSTSKSDSAAAPPIPHLVR